jgi:alpha,alpha-trehalase
MCWVAASRGADLAEERGDGERAKRRRAGAEKIKAEVLGKGVSARGVFRQHYKTDDLDASLLLLPIMGFLPPDDERVKTTALVRAVTHRPARPADGAGLLRAANPAAARCRGRVRRRRA